MSKYQVEMQYPDGTTELLDDIYDTYEDAEEAGLENISAYRAGGDVLHLSNPGDYPEDFDDADFEIIEI